MIIMNQLFVDRDRELEFLNESYRGKNSLIVIYGRRRIGKTELIKRFIKDKPHVFFLADERGDLSNLKELQRSMALYLHEPLFEKAEITDWIELFDEFCRRVEEKIIIVIDEFPYLVSNNKAIPSIFQKIWDLNLANKKVHLILCGSSIRMMESHVLSYRAPLYGRRSGQILLGPLKFRYLRSFFHSKDFEYLLKTYSVTDGIPLYLLKFDQHLDFKENLSRHVFGIGSFLYQEAEMLMKQELREMSNYFNILKAIASGGTRYGEIVNLTGLDKSIVTKYLDNLQSLHVVKREFPVTQKKETRNAHYVFEDNYFNFWFRFVFPNKSIIEEGKQKELLHQINPQLNLYVSKVFEKTCRGLLWDLKIGFTPTKIGRWWHKDREIDIVAINEERKQILFTECKWKDKVNAEKILKELKEKAKFVDWNLGKRKEHYCVIAKSFSRKSEDALCFDLRDLGGL